jgi:hypothetical protein
MRTLPDRAAPVFAAASKRALPDPVAEPPELSVMKPPDVTAAVHGQLAVVETETSKTPARADSGKELGDTVY